MTKAGQLIAVQPASLIVHLIFLLLPVDSPVHASSTSVSPSSSLSTGNSVEGHHNYLEAPANASRALPSPMNAIGSPVNALGSPYRVIASSIGSHPVALSSAPGMNFVTHASPQVGRCAHFASLQFAVFGLGKVPKPGGVGWLMGSLVCFGHLRRSAIKNNF